MCNSRQHSYCASSLDRSSGFVGYAGTAGVAPQAATPAVPKAAAPARAPTAGGGLGQVGVSTASKVYHCPGTKYYGTTKTGEYMMEAAAKAAGDHVEGMHGSVMFTGRAAWVPTTKE